MPDILPMHTEIERDGSMLLPVEDSHWQASRALQLEHGDPFDLLLAAAPRRGRELLTRDRKLLASGLE